MSRLKKIAMDINSFQSVINQTSQKGRNILKQLEDYKFTLEQTARLVNNNQALAQGMIKKRKSVDEISNKLYQIVFDIENMDISQAFQNQSQPVLQDAPTKNPLQQNVPPTNGTPPMNQPPVPGQQLSTAPGIPGSSPTMPSGGPAPSGNNNTNKDDSDESDKSKSDSKEDTPKKDDSKDSKEDSEKEEKE